MTADSIWRELQGTECPQEIKDTWGQITEGKMTEIANGILLQAVEDYAKLCGKSIRGRETKLDKKRIEEIEMFFNSKWGTNLMEHAGFAPEPFCERLREIKFEGVLTYATDTEN